MSQAKTTHLVIIPSYNAGGKLLEVVRDCLLEWPTVWVIIDGSDDGSDEQLEKAVGDNRALKIIKKTENEGKGAAVLTAAKIAFSEGFTHMLVMDSDGQHLAKMIPELMDISIKNPDVLLMGQPIFDSNAPKARVWGRKLTIFWTNLETLYAGLGDTLFGYRIYPIAPFIKAFGKTRLARRFDFDPELAVRMIWEGVKPMKIAIPVRYLSKEEGGVSHFNYLRDNIRLIWLHFRLLPEALLYQWIRILWRRTK